MRSRLLSAAIFCMLLAGCGGGGGQSVTPSSTPTPTIVTITQPPSTATPATASPQAIARLTITEPQSTSTNARKRNGTLVRGRHFLSPSTESVAIAVNNIPIAYPFGDTSPLCAMQGANLVCTIDVATTIGSAAISVTTYDMPDATGAALATATATATISGTTIVPLTLKGIAKSASLVLANANPPVGTATNVPVMVSVEDADENLITGPAPYASSIPIFNSDTSGHTTLSTSTLTSPQTTVSLAYDGAGVNATLLAFASPAPNNLGGNNRLVPGINGTEYALPSGETAGGYYQNAAQLTYGGDGKLYFISTSGLGRSTLAGVTSVIATNAIQAIAAPVPSNGLVWLMQYNALERFNSDNSFTSYALQSTSSNFVAGPDHNFWSGGNGTISKITPTGTVTSYALATSSTGGQQNPGFVTNGPDGNLWFSDYAGSFDKVTTAGAITYYPFAGSGGSSGPITAGSDGALWVGIGNGSLGFVRSTTAGAISMFPTTSYGGLRSATLSRDGNIWFTVSTQSQTYPDGFSKISPSGQVTDFVLLNVVNSQTTFGQIGNGPTSVLSTPDGSLWYTHDGFIGKFQYPAH